MAVRGGKATFQGLESGGTFTVQYNPKEFKFDRSVTWGEHKDQGPLPNGLEFTKIPPATVSMDLYFDTTADGNGDVRSKWVNGLLKLTNADVPVGEGTTDKKRPTKVQFSWGSFNMVCVVESVNTTFLMFSADGTPVRARVSVKLKEWTYQAASGGGGGSFVPGTKVRLVSSSGGTASSIASANGVSTRQLLDANPQITDPMNIMAGLRLVIPFL
ncbi:MAG: LysM peptidoglycan-binding domain-containing protein [Alphaproteobacteria bacterium]|nr:LysM peptidoglycan-binding domain-containing protein [Alphaproteobacteria bacterium]